MSRHRYWNRALVFLSALTPAITAEEPISRVVLAFYDSDHEKVEWTKTHQWAETPLNHLGLVVRYRDINLPLPSLRELEDVRGILLWRETDWMPDPLQFLSWANELADDGKRLVLLGDLPFRRDGQGRKVPMERLNRYLSKLGLEIEDAWVSVTYDVDFERRDPRMIDFERPLGGILPSFSICRAQGASTSFLRVRHVSNPDLASDLVVVSRTGAFAAGDYIVYESGERRAWILNPFEFFRRSFDTDEIPKPDVTTVSGRRIFYSHIDGDGWLNRSQIGRYRTERRLASEVILEEILREFPGLPVTVAPIVAEIDPAWAGTERSQKVARLIFSLPHVSAGSHTYSHPFDWSFFEDDRPEKERVFSSRYAQYWGRDRDKGGASSTALADLRLDGNLLPNADGSPEDGESLYAVPRAFAHRPFNLDLEIGGSVEFIQRLLPDGKEVELMQWSGDTLPFETALAAASRADLLNINGGDSRFDRDFPSYAWVSPIGRQVGAEIQIYASNSNENTYTDLWTDRHFGFVHLVETLRNTETPLRLKPLNVYYHMYSGEREASLEAVRSNLEYAENQEIAPISAARYAGIAKGFFKSQIVQIAEKSWRILNRGELQTVRFDRATLESVDFSKSQGVVGQRHVQGSLYVALDPAVARPLVTLRPEHSTDQDPPSSVAYLIQSRWLIRNLSRGPLGFECEARGHGPGEFVWRVPETGLYNVEVTSGQRRVFGNVVPSSPDRTLRFTIERAGVGSMHIQVTRVSRR